MEEDVTYNEIETNMLDQITKFCRNKSDIRFTLLINGTPLYHRYGKPPAKPKNVYVRYNSDIKVQKLEFCIYLKRQYVSIPELEKVVLKKLSETKVEGVDVGLQEEDIQISLESNLSLRLLDIRQNHYSELFNAIYRDGEHLNTNLLTDEDLSLLRVGFDQSAISNYTVLVNLRILRYLKSASKTRVELKFYNTFKCFIPIFITGNVIFNPFLEASKYRDAVRDSQIFQEASTKVVSLGDLSIYYISHARFCETMNFARYTKLTNALAIQLFGGVFSDLYPNCRNYLYINQDIGDKLTEQEFRDLPSAEERATYRQVDSLLLRSALCYKILGYSNTQELYDAWKTIKMKRIGE